MDIGGRGMLGRITAFPSFLSATYPLLACASSIIFHMLMMHLPVLSPSKPPYPSFPPQAQSQTALPLLIPYSNTSLHGTSLTGTISSSSSAFHTRGITNNWAFSSAPETTTTSANRSVGEEPGRARESVRRRERVLRRSR